MKNKTVAAWLAFVGGPLGMHRFYLHGLSDMLGWLLPIPTALGIYGIQRVQQLGQDDHSSWVLIPLLGFTIAACALRAILYALMTPEAWNARYNPSAAPDAATPEELADPEAYQRYEARQNLRVYRDYVKAADTELPKLRAQVSAGRAGGLTPEQLREGEEKLRRIEDMRNQLLGDHPELSAPPP